MESDKQRILNSLKKKYSECHSICYTPGEILHDNILMFMVENGYSSRQPVIDKFIREGLKQNGF